MSEITKESVEQQNAQAEMIFTAISTSMDNIDDAKNALVMLYVPDMTFSRAAISLALTQLEKHYD